MCILLQFSLFFDVFKSYGLKVMSFMITGKVLCQLDWLHIWQEHWKIVIVYVSAVKLRLQTCNTLNYQFRRCVMTPIENG